MACAHPPVCCGAAGGYFSVLGHRRDWQMRGWRDCAPPTWRPAAIPAATDTFSSRRARNHAVSAGASK
eukprot:4553362-Prymnesium_polylepis.2